MAGQAGAPVAAECFTLEKALALARLAGQAKGVSALCLAERGSELSGRRECCCDNE